MDHAKALATLRSILLNAQKARANLFESGLTEQDILALGLHKWLVGPVSILPKLAEAIRRAEAGEAISGSDLYNWCLIATKLESIIALASELTSYGAIPKPDLGWFGQNWRPA